MNSRDAFKVGFLTFCADQGMSGAEASACMQKAASILEKKALGLKDLVGPAAGLYGLGKTTAVGLGVGVPVAIGAGVGALASNAMHPEVDADDVKKQELIDEYRSYARRAREKQRTKTLISSR